MLNALNVQTTRRLALSLMGAAAALLFSALNLVGVGVTAHDKSFAAGISESLIPLAMSFLFGLLALISTEISDHKSTPRAGHPHSKRNYLETAFIFIAFLGLGSLL